MNIKKHIPNSITSLNLLCGVVAVVAVLVYRQPVWAMWLIALAAFFDLLDGLAARILRVSSPIGADLDSLADLISFGLAPAILIFGFALPEIQAVYANVDCESHSLITAAELPVLSKALLFSPVFLIAVFAAVRLAKFNNDTRQHDSFIGLPVPANALFWVGLASLERRYDLFDGRFATMALLYLLVGLFCYFMVSGLPMFSFKIKSIGWVGNQIRYIFLLVSVLLLIFLGAGGFAPIIFLYIIIAIIATIIRRSQ